MAVGLTAPEKLLPVSGVRLSCVAAGIRYQERDDLLLMELCENAKVAAVFTQNKFCAAPVLLSKEHLQKSNCRGLLINAGNANAGTGEQGYLNAQKSCEEVASQLGFSAEQILPFSTGVIGEQLNMQAMLDGVGKLKSGLKEDAWLAAANAIMTTDTIAKGSSEQVDIDGVPVTITGIAKGAGMICPNMATLLAYVATDANISDVALQSILNDVVEQSFNRITVDSDTSTNDALVLMATGKAPMQEIKNTADKRYKQLYEAIEQIMVELATSVVRDAEGANKFVKIDVVGAGSNKDCETVAYTVAHSPLVKTALYASDANWGRILAAAGRAEIDNLDVSKISISINDVLIIENGEPCATYTEEQGQQVMQNSDLVIRIFLGANNTAYHVWTSDLSHDYVSINADYRS